MSLSIIEWYDDAFFSAWEQANDHGWESLSRRDQVLVGVGLLIGATQTCLRKIK